MVGKKRVHSSTNSLYKLKIFRYSKPYDSSLTGGPKSRSGHRIVCNDKYMYSVGGFNPIRSISSDIITSDDNNRSIGTIFHEVWQYNFDSNTWKKLETRNMPKELASCAATMSGNLLFLYGGTSIPFGDRINEEVSVCNLLAPNAVMEFNRINVEEVTKPLKQYGQSIVIDGTYLYTVGGTDGYLYTMDVYRLDLRTKVWEKLNNKAMDDNEPPSRYRHEIVLYNGYIFVFGGGTSDSAFNLEEIPAFNLKKRRWETFETTGDESLSFTYPGNRRCHAVVQNPHNPAIVFINGGVNEQITFKDTWKLNLDSRKWTCIRSLILPLGTYFHTAAPTPEGKMVIFGGIVQRNGSSIRTADVYTTWITIPKLKHACWDAIVHYVRNGTIKVPRNLKTFGLTPEFESRLRNCV